MKPLSLDPVKHGAWRVGVGSATLVFAYYYYINSDVFFLRLRCYA